MIVPILHCLLLAGAPPATQLQYAVEVTTSNTVGQVIRRRVIEGRVDTGSREEAWSHVLLSDGDGKPEAQTFMDGLRYDSRIQGVLKPPAEAKKLPEMATEARDIVDDLVMFREFAAWSKKLKTGAETAFRPTDAKASGLNVGTILSPLGTASLDGHRCRIVKYENFFSPMDLKFPGIHLVGRSRTWGEIWVDQQNGSLVRGTMREDLLGDLTMGDSSKPTAIDVLRRGTLTLRHR